MSSYQTDTHTAPEGVLQETDGGISIVDIIY